MQGWMAIGGAKESNVTVSDFTPNIRDVISRGANFQAGVIE